jgi:hydrogenase expression/formation protein HypC
MCLSVPARIISIEAEMARVSVGGSILTVSLQLVEDVAVGDYVLVHTGFALEKINAAEAENTLRLLKELSENPEDTRA